MNRLLAANFTRLKKDKVFWLGMLVMFVFGAYIIIRNYLDMQRDGTQIAPDDLLFGYTILVGIVAAVFCSLYLGTEYSDGTMRNKLIVGHTRPGIYLANLIVCISAGFLMVLAYLIPAIGLGMPLLGTFSADGKIIVLTLLGSLIMVLALTAIFTLVSMLIQNKAFAAVVAIVGIFALLFAAISIANILNAPPTYEGYSFTNDSGVVQSGETIPNPRYVSGTKREVYETVLEILPTGQALEYASMGAAHTWRMSLYSLAITVITTGAGILVFRRKDIK
ncbi:ABC transporter permease [Anaerovorax odorimutans]|uniref:ABC transporter permease n=1 Tax=Anaerovorax odorimutans TaxID=109327 RepID=A0ABT1RR86_9FIRM|nr:ABC transporter permease subunit [Anaerovorax odorimutans]MCQ4637714.1 ABC transporter permease [Anaerovorax odorimutans]